MKNKIKILATSTMVGLAIITASAASFSQDDEQGFSLPPMPVAALKVTPRDLPQYLSGIGRLEAVNQVNMTAETSGRISKLNFTSGQEVKAGQLLLQIDDSTDRAQLSQFEARLQLAKKQLERARDLKGLASSEARVDETQATLDEIKGRIAEINVEIQRKKVTAPFSGFLGIRQINLGQYIEPGDVIVSLTDTSKFTAIFQLPEQVLARIALGQTVEINIDAFPDETFKGKLIAVEPQVDRNNHTISAQAFIPGDTSKLRSGLFAQGKIFLPAKESVLMVPETAVERSTYGDTVFTVDTTSNTAKRKSVSLGERRDGYVVIKSGLDTGETVVISGLNRLFEGSSVIIKPTDKITSVVPTTAQ